MSKISELTTMTQGDINPTVDYIPILDVDKQTVKKISPYVLQGYTLNANPLANITSLCTSDYTIYNADAMVISGRLVRFGVILSNGTTGIPLQVPTVGGENLFTLPSDYFVTTLPCGLFVRVWSEIPPTAAYKYPVNNIPMWIDGRKLIRSAGPTWNSNLFLSNCITANNGLKGLEICGLALLKYNVTELPYS